jgi:hypothetical protein
VDLPYGEEDGLDGSRFHCCIEPTVI